MKRTCLLMVVLAALVLLALPLPVQAQEEAARYNFASAQGDKELQIPPGQEGRCYIYFYNVDGNRITHISLDVSQAPAGWQVSIEPPLGETQVSVSGLPTKVTENLYVEPSELLTEEPQNVPEGMVSIKVPGRGYALGKLAQVVVRVPDSTPLGTTGSIKVAAEAAWLGQSGSAAVKQARDFDFLVTVTSASTEYSEKIIGQGEAPKVTGNTPETKTSEANHGDTPSSPAKSSGSPLIRWLPAIVAGVVVILGAIILLLVRRRG